MSNPTPLLVPVEVQAMVLNSASVNFVRAQMNYGQLSTCQSPEPAPFQEDQVDFATHLENHGVYLRWTLPQALRHATQNSAGGLDFPFVPNRWLVLRLYYPAGSTAAPQIAAWMVQSDALKSSTGVNYLDPTQAQFTPTQMGQMVDITASQPWVEPSNPDPYFLRAVAEANPAFAAYQPFNQNVFSIHDPLQTLGLDAGTLSYFVQGWTSDPSADVLATWPGTTPGGDFDSALKALGWAASPHAQGSHSTVYHGAAFGVNWQPQGSPPPSPKDQAKPQLALGNTSVDAVVAFAEAAFSAPGVTPPAGLTAQQAADLLEAFQYNLLPLLGQPGGEQQLEQTIRKQWFGSIDAGCSWTLVDAPQVPGSPPPAALSASEQAKEAAWLAALNQAQSQFDSALRSLMGVQRQLFELWWKQQAMNAVLMQTGHFPWATSPTQFDAALDPTNATGLIAQARQWVAQLATLAAQIPQATATTTLATAIANFSAQQGLPTTRLLQAVAAPRFWQAAEPVLVLSGTAHLMKIDSDAQLNCRWPSELVTALNISTGSGGPSFTLSSAQLASTLPTFNTSNLPDTTQALFAEFCLLDPSNAALGAQAAGQHLTPTQLDAMAASLAAPNPASGTLPAVLSAYPWTQPWQPLYLDWAVDWYPVPFTDANGQANWAFNGSDYDLVPGVKPPTPVALTGRCVLTPKPSFEFKARIDQFIADNPGSAATQALQAIENLVGTVDQWDFLSQAFNGLSTQLASWAPVATLLPPATPLPGGGSLASLLGGQVQHPPNPQLATPGRVVPPSTFEGMRGGQLHFTRLSIVDVFGQTLEVITGQTASQTQLLTADGLHVSEPLLSVDTAGLAQLPPRLLQPARLNLRFTPPSPGSTGSNPIAGWLLVNHVDASLACYGVDGTLYGELSPATDAKGQAFVAWWQAPDSPYADLSKLQQDQPRFGGLLATLQGNGPTALSEFLQSIDETMWTVNPLGDRADGFLSVLLGRPLAVVSASIGLELQAQAWTDPAWPYTFTSTPPQPRFLSYQFPVQLGDLAARNDGLLGYFVDQNFAQCNVLHLPQGASSGYLKAQGPGNWVSLGFAAQGPGPTHDLTLILDPRAALHAQCGLLPGKAVSLLANWVDPALKAMRVCLRGGPLLASTSQLIPVGQSTPVPALLTPCPAERNGSWQWRQMQTDHTWPSTALGPVDALASFPDSAPLLRVGVLQLSGGLETE
ncbi:MAG: hypothetical protein Q8N13_07875 [Acidovorax sp.]|nr:hypothetical protein [Acidovorax sp.]